MTNYWWVIIGTMYNAQVSANWLMTTSLIIIQFRNKLINLIQTFGPKNHFSGVPRMLTRSNYFILQLASLRLNWNWNEFSRNCASNSLGTLTLCILSKSAKYATVSYRSSQPTPLSSAKNQPLIDRKFDETTYGPCFFWNYSLGAGNVNALRQWMHDKLEPLAPQVANLNRDGQLYIELSPCSF